MRDQVADSSVEALDHAVGLRVAWWGEPVLDVELGAGDVKGVIARGLFAGARESIRELSAVVGQDLLDDHRCDALEPAQEVRAAGLGLIEVGAKVDPARGLVLYDLSSSYFEGSACPLAKRGYSRDGRPGTLQRSEERRVGKECA